MASIASVSNRKRKRTVLTISEKLDICKLVRNGYRDFSDEIVSIVREDDTECTEEELEDEEGITQVTVSHATACNSLQTVLTYLEQ